ncbi:MAG: sugar phosphate isomerase/epimerase [Bacteroidia bacterium]|nr:sugar phosphate isomerase/epimerase [Bacteroidia bacterium]
MKYTRNEFLKLSGVGITGAALSKIDMRSAKDEKLTLGLASYTLRSFSLDDTIKTVKRLNLSGISLKSMHMPLESSSDEIKMITEKVRSAGINLYGAGVIYMKTEKEVESAFAYANNAGLEMIVGVPNHELLSQAEEQVKKYNIKLAIHNHGPDDKIYPSPVDVYEKIKGLDQRIGLCIDIGHTQRTGMDPSIMIERYKHRLYDLHMKDVTKVSSEDVPIEIGRGIIDIPKVIKTLKKIKYQGNVAFEFEKDEKDPLPGLAESVGYVKGIIKTT